MDERSGVERLVALPLAALAMGQGPELLVDEWKQVVKGLPPAASKLSQPVCNGMSGGVLHDVFQRLQPPRHHDRGASGIRLVAGR